MTGRSQHRGGRGPGRGFPSRGGRGGRNNQSKSSGNKRQTERKYLFHPNSTQDFKYYTFPEILKSMVSKMRANEQWAEAPLVTDALEALESKPPTAPDKPQAVKKIVDGKEVLSYDELEIAEWKSKLSQYQHRKDKYDKIYQQSAAYIYEKYCTPRMKQELSDLKTWDTQLKKDPVALLLKIRTVVSEGATTVHPILSDVQMTQRTYSPKQDYTHSTESYIKMVQNNTDQYFDAMGWDSVDSMAKKRADYIDLTKQHTGRELTKAQDAYITAYRRQYVAILAFTGLQEGRYGTYKSDVQKAFILDGTDLYPPSLDDLREVLASGKFKPTKEWLDKQNSRKSDKAQAKKPPFDPNKHIGSMPAAMFYQQKAKGEACYCCGSPDHKSFNCPKKDKLPKDKWAINQFNEHKKSFFQQYHQFQQAQENSQGTQETPAPPPTQVPPSPVFVQPAISSEMQSHRSGFSPMTIPPTLQQFPNTQQQYQQQSVQQPSNPTPSSSFQFRPQMFCVPIPASTQRAPQVDKVTLAGVGKRQPLDPGVDKYDYLDSASSLNSVSDPALM